MNRDQRAIDEARENKFVIDGMNYSYKCTSCRGVRTDGCDSCKGSGVLCDLAKLKRRQQVLYGGLMRFRIPRSVKYNYLGVLYQDGRNGLSADPERARIFFDMAEKAGFVKNEIARIKRAGACPKSIEALEWVAERYPESQDVAEAKILIVVFRDKLLYREIRNAERAHSSREAIDILEKAVEKYPDARSISVANNKLQHYRQQYKAEQERQRESYGGGFKVVSRGNGGGMSWERGHHA